MSLIYYLIWLVTTAGIMYYMIDSFADLFFKDKKRKSTDYSLIDKIMMNRYVKVVFYIWLIIYVILAAINTI